MSNPLINMDAGAVSDFISVATSTGNDEGVIRTKENRWLLKTVDPSNVLMSGVLVPEGAMNAFRQGDDSEFAIGFDDISNMIEDKSQEFEIEYATDYLYYRHAGFEAEMDVTPAEDVPGNALSTPSLNQAVEATGSISPLQNFIKKASSVINTDTMLFAPRDEGLHLFAEQDGPNLHHVTEWDEFDDVDIDLDKAEDGPSGQPPVEDLGGVDSVFSIDFLSEIYWAADKVQLQLDHHAPAKFLMETEAGIKVSYIISPRVPSGESVLTLPDRVRHKEQQELV